MVCGEWRSDGDGRGVLCTPWRNRERISTPEMEVCLITQGQNMPQLVYRTIVSDPPPKTPLPEHFATNGVCFPRTSESIKQCGGRHLGAPAGRGKNVHLGCPRAAHDGAVLNERMRQRRD